MEQAWNPPAVIVVAYLAGVALMLAWILVGLAAVWRLLRSARPAPLECRILLHSLGGPASERVALVVSSRVAQPCAVAWPRTTIVLPQELVAQQDPQALRWALAHEWSHVERSDLTSWLASGLVRAVYFYQPLVWWLRGQLQLSQDFLADSAAANQGNGPEDYAEFLTTSCFTRPTLAAGLGIGGRISDLQRRVVMLIDRRRPLERVSPRSWNLATIVAAVLVVGVAAGLAPEDPQPESSGGKRDESEQSATPAVTKGAAPVTVPAATPAQVVSKPVSAVPEGVIEMELRRDPEIEMLLRRAADLEARQIGARSAKSPDRAVVEEQLRLLNELIEVRKAQLRPQLVQGLAARGLTGGPQTIVSGQLSPATMAPRPTTMAVTTYAPSVPDAKRNIRPGDVLSVVVLDNLEHLPALNSRLLLYPKLSELIATVDSEGEILLGTRYGSVKVDDMTLLKASAFVSNVIQEYIHMRANQERQRLLKSEPTDAAEKQAQKIKAQAISDALGRLEVNVRVSYAGTGPDRTPIPTGSYAPAIPVYSTQIPQPSTMAPAVAPPSQRTQIVTSAVPTVSPYLQKLDQLPAGTITAGDVLNIECEPPESMIKPVVTVELDGRIALGVRYGRVNVGGKSLTEAEEIIRSAVAKLVEGPVVQVTFGKRGGY